MRAITMELRRSNTNPLGAKGAGEGGMVAVARPWPMRSRRRWNALGVESAICRFAGAAVDADPWSAPCMS